MILCPTCQQAYQPHKPLLIQVPKFDLVEKHHIDPRHIVMARAQDRGVMFFMADGRELFDYYTLSSLAEKYGELFVRPRYGCLVRKSRVEGYRKVSENIHQLLVRGLKDPVPVSRRYWYQVAVESGFNPKAPPKERAVSEAELS